MDRKQLRALLAVAEHRSFSAAARSLDTVQSNVSAHVARLERELDVALVDRATNELTAEGRAVIDRARRIEAEFEALVSDVAAMHDVISGSVRLGVIGTTARWLVPLLFDALTSSFPGIHLVVLDATTSSLVLQLHSGQLDLAVINTPIDDPDLVVEPLFDEDRILIAPHGHPLAEHARVTLADLARHDLLLEASGTAFRDELDAFAAEQGVVLRPKAEFDGMRLLASLAFAGFGAAIVPASAAPEQASGDWRRVEIDGLPGRSTGMARRRRGLPSAAQRAVQRTLAEVVIEQSPRSAGIRPTVRAPR